jgi:hypothetical protein
MNRKSLTIILSAIAAMLGLYLTAKSDSVRVEALDSITAAELKSIVSFLASDEMRGREADSPANEIAARYLAHSFELLGLEPAGDDGSYYQHVKLTRSRMGGDNQFHLTDSVSDQTLEGKVLSEFWPSRHSGKTEASGQLVFVGYGITAPELSYDDYHGIDVRGKIAVVLEREPGEKDPQSPFEGLISSDYSRAPYKIMNAQTHGAVGVILTPPSASGRKSRSSWGNDGEARGLALDFWSSDLNIPAVHASRSFFDKILKDAIDLDEVVKRIDERLGPESQELGRFQAMIRTDVSHEQLQVENVLARLSGSDPLVRHEAVLISAHFDHVGARDDRIYNGADDDASGTAAILEIAEAFVQNPVKPRRSIVFSLWNAEEKGLLGARHYVHSPRHALQDTIGVLQLDMIGRNQEVNDPEDRRFAGLEAQAAEDNANSLHVVGYSRSSDLKQLVEQNNSEIGIELRYDLDNHPLKLIARSDHWPFLLKGVPALLFTTGLHPDYHQTSDTAEKINYPKMERVTRLVFLCTWDLANRSIRPVLDERVYSHERDNG